MSEAATTKASETTESTGEGQKAAKESCTGPLKPMPEDKDFKKFVGEMIGTANEKKAKIGLGLGLYEQGEDKRFPSNSIEGIFRQDFSRYEECTDHRINKDQLDKDGNKVREGYGEAYNLKPVSYMRSEKYVANKEKLLEKSKLKPEDLDELKKSLDDLEGKDKDGETYEITDGKGPHEFLKGMFGAAANMMNEPVEGLIPKLLNDYYNFLKEHNHDSIDALYKGLEIDEYGKKLYDLYELRDDTEIPESKHDPFKAIMCFAHYKAMIDEKKKEMKGGADELVVFGDGNRWRRIVVRMLAVFFLICYGFLIYESSRLLMSSINRVLDAREAYYQTNPDMREGDEVAGSDGGYMSYLYGIGQVAIEIFGGGLISSITTIQDFAVDQARQAASKISDTAGRTMVERHSNGVVSFINGFLTGDTQAEATAVAGIERQSEMNRISNEAITEVNLGFQRIVDDAAFSANGFVTGINGMATSLVVLGNTIRPDIYRIEHVTASCAALRGAYSPDKMLKYASTTGNLAILFTPRALPSYPQPVDESSRDVVPVEEETKGLEPEAPVPEQAKPSTGIFSFLTGTSDESVPAEDKKKKSTQDKSQKEIDAAEALADLSGVGKKGGKRKTGKKLIDIFGGRKKRKTSKNNKKRKTIKKKSKKGKTKKRKTLKRRRKGKK